MKTIEFKLMAKEKYSIWNHEIDRLLGGWGLLMFLVVGMMGCTNEVPLQERISLKFIYSAPNARAISDPPYIDYTGTDFGVYADLYAPQYTNSTKKQNYLGNIKVSNNGGTCSTEGTHYWPYGVLHFSAYSPYMQDLASGTMQITMPSSPYAGYTFEGEVDGRTNFMYADEMLGSLNNFNGGTVPVVFRHALTKVTFAVRNLMTSYDNTQWDITLKSIQLKNIRNNGSITFTHKNEIPNAWVSNTEEIWIPYSGSDDYELVNIPTNKPLSTSYASINDCLYLMPQELINIKDGTDNQLLYISYELKTTENVDDPDLITTTTETINAEVPIRSNAITHWRTNQHVHYNITISAIKPILFDPLSNTWNNENDDIVIQ